LGRADGIAVNMKTRKIINVGAWLEYSDKDDAYTVHFRDRLDRTEVISIQRITRHSSSGIVGYIHEDVKPRKFKWKWWAKIVRDRKSLELFKECGDACTSR